MAPKKRGISAREVEVDDTIAAADAVTTPPGSPQTDAVCGSAPVAELYNTLQTVVANDVAAVNDCIQELLQLLIEAENPDTPLLLRVRTLEFVARYGQHLRDGNTLKKVVASLVKILSGPEEIPQLLVAAVQGIASLGPVSVLDKKWEYLSREGADVLMQIMLDQEGFSENVRQAASKALDNLISTAFRPVVTKLLHWISDDREAEEEEQLLKERQMAMSRLLNLAQAPRFQSQWSEEVQEHVLSLIIRVFSTVTVQEFAQLARIAASLPMVREKSGLPLLTGFLARNNLSSDRALESLSIIASHVASTPCDIAPALEEAGLLTMPLDPASKKGLWHAKALLLAAQLATTENTDKLYAVVVEQLTHVVGDGSVLPENLTTLEALLLALSAVGQKKPVDLLKLLNDNDFSTKCGTLMQQIREMELLVVYAVKRLVQKSCAGPKESEALGCCHNVRVLLGSFSSKHIPMGAMTESWAQKYKLPTLKRARDAPTRKTGVSGGVGAHGIVGSIKSPLDMTLPTKKKARGEDRRTGGVSGAHLRKLRRGNF